MTSFKLKIFALVTMLTDHVGWMIFPEISILRDIGRLSFPIFAFLIAEGSIKTSNINSYLNRLIIFGFISQIPYSISGYLVTGNIYTLNIFFTLAGGLLLIKLIQQRKYFLFSISFILFTIFDFFAHYDYGVYGLLLILFSYLLIKNQIWGTLAIIALTILESLLIPLGQFSISQIEFRNQIFAILSLVPILLYKGEQGTKISKWYFYVFYPLHLLILSLVFVLL
jgi:hypothetical protein